MMTNSTNCKQLANKIFIFFVCFFILLITNQTYADHCGNNQIKVGDDKVHTCVDKPTTYKSQTSDDTKVAIVRDAQGTYETQQAECQKKYGKSYCDCKNQNGIYLNTDVPFIGRCLVSKGDGSEGINILQALTKILMTFVMIGGFGTIVWGGAQIASGDVVGGKSKIIGVMIAFALLGSLGAILRFINPNFFS